MNIKRHLRGAAAVVRQGALIATRRARAPVERRPQASIHVVFVHGYMAASPIFDPFRRELVARLGLDTSAIDYGPAASYENVARALAAHAKAESSRRLVLIGHSLGGLLVRDVVRRFALAPELVVTLATPHRGTTMAARVPGSLAETLRPGNEALRRIAMAPPPANALNFIAEDDATVPRLSARWPGVEEHVLDRTGHNAIVFDSRVWQLTEAAIRRLA